MKISKLANLSILVLIGWYVFRDHKKLRPVKKCRSPGLLMELKKKLKSRLTRWMMVL
ncbi:MAG: hypothetical protein QM737_15775 [Ferruginibacter sp.]